MPTSTRANEVIARVLAEHDLSQAWLCDETGLDSSYISRVLSGQYSVPPEVIRAVWRKTLDARVAALAIGEHAMLAVNLPSPLPAAAEAASAAMVALGHAIARLAQHIELDTNLSRADADRAATEAIRTLSILRHAMRPGRTPPAALAQARPFSTTA